MRVPFGTGRASAGAGLAQDLRVLEDRDVEADRLLGVLIEPQERGDLLRGHGESSLSRGGRLVAVQGDGRDGRDQQRSERKPGWNHDAVLHETGSLAAPPEGAFEEETEPVAGFRHPAEFLDRDAESRGDIARWELPPRASAQLRGKKMPWWTGNRRSLEAGRRDGLGQPVPARNPEVLLFWGFRRRPAVQPGLIGWL